ncbi:MAG TPA: O-antigen ligase family protein [Candidatus Dormibacteraeota bacterium]|nr:O-antigen ligase family protein [Candidatus Dormibacteraeota bacterium]
MKVIRIAIPALVVFAVLAYGAVEPWSVAILEAGSALLLVLWVLTEAGAGQIELRSNPLIWAAGGLVVLALLQWAGGLTVYGYATKLAAMQLFAEWILLFLTIQAFRTPRQWKRLVWFLMILAFAVSLFAIVQYFTWNGKLYWIQPLQHGGQAFGPFVDRDDFAGFAELILPLGLALLLFDGERQERRLLVGLFVVFPAAALLLSSSRAGVVCFLFELFLLGILTGMLGRRSQRWLLAGMVVAILALAVWLGVGYTVQRFIQGNGTEMSLISRLEMSRDTLHIFLDHPLLGTGMGTFETAYPRYQTHSVGLIVNHAHNDYVELLSDGGIVAGIFGLAFLVILYRHGIRNLRRARTPLTRSLYAGGLVACTGLLTHELVDFNLHIPSNAIIFLVIAALTTAVIPEPIAKPRHGVFHPNLPS